MPYYLYVYSPSDFVTPPPAESGAMAEGTPNFTLELVPGATPTLIEVADDDAVFDEVDSQQELVNAINLDGTSYAAGTTINTAYDLINTGTGHKVTSFHFGGDGYQQGAVDGIVSTVELVPGTTYSFDTERTSHQQNNQYSDYVACFTEACLIETDRGQVAVEDLCLGDMVRTMHNGFRPVRWIGSRTVPAVGKFAPIVFAKGAIGNFEELVVSPEHRMLMRGARVELLFGQDAVLAPAKALVDGDRIYRRTGGTVRYFHFMCDEHEIVFAQGAPCETFLPESCAMAGMGNDALEELLALFPELDGRSHGYQAAAPCLRPYEARLLEI